MRCKTALKLLGPYVDKQLNLRSSVALKKHIASCPDCRHELESLKGIKIEMDNLSVPPLPPFLADRIVACANDGLPRPEIRWLLKSFYFQVSKWMAPAALVCGLLMGTAMGGGNTPGSNAMPLTAEVEGIDSNVDCVYSLCCWNAVDQRSIEQVTLALMEN